MPKQDGEVPPSILVKLAREYTVSDTIVGQTEIKLKEVKVKRAIAEKKLVDEMTTQQVKSFKTDRLGGFRTQVMVYPNVKDREVLLAYIKKRKLQWLFTTSIHGQKLRSFVTELMEQSKPIPPGIEPFTKTEIRRYK